jgi:hypothetical protein
MKTMAIVLGQPLCSKKILNDAFGHFSIIGKANKLKDMKLEKWGTYLKIGYYKLLYLELLYVIPPQGILTILL